MSIHITSNTKSNNSVENLTNKFSMRLVKPIDGLNNNVYLEVQNICYPLTTKNIDESICYFNFAFKFEKFMKNKLGIKKYGEEVGFLSRKYNIPTGIYDLNRLLDYMNNILKEYDTSLSLEKNGKVYLNVNFGTEYWLVQYNSNKAHDNGEGSKFRLSEKVEEISFELNLSPALAFMLGFKKSKIKLDNKKEKFIELEADYLPDVSDGLNKMYIYCEELEATIVGDSYSELLTTIPIQWSGQGKGTGELACFSPSKSLKKFKKSIITTLNFSIKDNTDKLIPFDSGTVSLDCLIHYA